MIVRWNRYQKTENEVKAKQSEKTLTTELNSHINQVINENENKSDNNQQIKDDLFTSTSTSNLFTNNFQKTNSMTELDMSSISSNFSLDKGEDINSNNEDGRFNNFLLRELESIFNSDSLNSTHLPPSEFFLIKQFHKSISNQYLFNCLMSNFFANPPLFLEKYFALMIDYSMDIIANQISHSILIESFTYFTLRQMKTFLRKVIAKYLNIIIKNQYGIIVLSKFVESCLSINDESILMSLIHIIVLNFSNIITDENSSKIIHTLLNINNPLISNMIIEAIGKNSLSTALSPNGVHITKTFINCPVLRELIVDTLVPNINVLLIHYNGNKVIELLLNLKISSISIDIIKSILSNISFISNADFYLILIEKSLMSLDSVSAAHIQQMLNDPFLVDFLTKNQIGSRIINYSKAFQEIISQNKVHSNNILKR